MGLDCGPFWAARGNIWQRFRSPAVVSGSPRGLNRARISLSGVGRQTKFGGSIVGRVLSIDPQRFNNEAYLNERLAAATPSDRGKLRTALTYLYWDNGPINLERDRRKIAEPYLDEAECLLVRWLSTRTNGSERKNYGKAALIAARSSRYRCATCGFPDVRALHLDHVKGRKVETPFACLCANCHTIKSRKSDWLGRVPVPLDPSEPS